MNKKKKIYWSDTKLPAHLFFEILESENLKLLSIKGKPSKSDLSKAWSNIFDEFYSLKNDTQLKQILRRKKSIIELNANIKISENALKVITIFKDVLVDDRLKNDLESLYNSLKQIGIHLDITKPINTEVLSVLQISVATYKTKLKIEQDELKSLTSGAKSSFEDSCVGIENVLDRTINEKVSLRKYVSLEKSAKEKNKRLMSQNRKSK